MLEYIEVEGELGPPTGYNLCTVWVVILAYDRLVGPFGVPGGHFVVVW